MCSFIYSTSDPKVYSSKTGFLLESLKAIQLEKLSHIILIVTEEINYAAQLNIPITKYIRHSLKLKKFVGLMRRQQKTSYRFVLAKGTGYCDRLYSVVT